MHQWGSPRSWEYVFCISISISIVLSPSGPRLGYPLGPDPRYVTVYRGPLHHPSRSRHRNSDIAFAAWMDGEVMKRVQDWKTFPQAPQTHQAQGIPSPDKLSRPINLCKVITYFMLKLSMVTRRRVTIDAFK